MPDSRVYIIYNVSKEHLPYSEGMCAEKSSLHITNLYKVATKQKSMLNSWKTIYNFSFTKEW